MTKFSLFVIGIACIGLLTACKKDKAASESDKTLFNLANVPSGYLWFENVDSLYSKSSGSGHAYPYLKTRYNTIAQQSLDATGRIMENATFQEGALIVKELINEDETVGRYAILQKNSNSPDADAKGWVWGYINADGSVAVPAKDKGTTCISCHTQSGNIDYMLMNKFFP